MRIVTLLPKRLFARGSKRPVTLTRCSSLCLMVLASVACTPEPRVPLDVPVTAAVSLPSPETASTEPAPPEAPVGDAGDAGDAERSELPSSWVEPKGLAVPFADAMKRAREARDAFHGLGTVAPVVDPALPDASAKAWFVKAEALVDRASRAYATAFHAADATREGAIDAMAEAAEVDALFARRLDEANLGTLPAAWKSDPAVRATFEDVAQGPFKRWRDEARVLAKRCVAVAAETSVRTAAAKRCGAIRTPAVPSKGTACPCNPGDPLCSASIGGWCASPAPP